jgi:hypothetical protein
VLVLEVRPAPEKIESARLYGLPGSIEPTRDGYLIKTQGPQGQSARFVVMLPPGSQPIAADVRPDLPKQPKRIWAPTPLKILAAESQGTLFEVTFRRKAAPTELSEWKIQPGELAEGVAASWNARLPGNKTLRFPLFVDVAEGGLELPLTDDGATRIGLGPLANFTGGYIDNAFGESQETWIELKTGAAHPVPGSLISMEVAPTSMPLDASAKDPRKGWWLQTTFYLPFINMMGAEPAFDEHPRLVLPMLRYKQVKEIKAWINGIPLPVERYAYPRNPQLACHYADLLGSGARGEQENTLVVHLQC